MAYRARVGMALCSQTLPPQKLCPRRLADEEQGLSVGPLEVSLAPAQCSLRGRFWRSGDRPADHTEMRPRSLPSSLLRQRASPVSHLRVSDCRPCCSKYKCQRMFSCGSKSHCLGVCLADRSSSSPFPSCSIMRAGMVDGKRGQKRRSSPGARVVFPYADLTHPHVASLCAVLSELHLGRGRERFALTVFLK